MAFYISDQNGKLIKYAGLVGKEKEDGTTTIDPSLLDGKVDKQTTGTMGEESVLNSFTPLDKDNNIGINISSNTGEIPLYDYMTDGEFDHSIVGSMLSLSPSTSMLMNMDIDTEYSVLSQTGIQNTSNQSMSMVVVDTPETSTQNYTMLDQTGVLLQSFTHSSTTGETNHSSVATKIDEIVLQCGHIDRDSNETRSIISVKDGAIQLGAESDSSSMLMTISKDAITIGDSNVATEAYVDSKLGDVPEIDTTNLVQKLSTLDELSNMSDISLTPGTTNVFMGPAKVSETDAGILMQIVPLSDSGTLNGSQAMFSLNPSVSGLMAGGHQMTLDSDGLKVDNEIVGLNKDITALSQTIDSKVNILRQVGGEDSPEYYKVVNNSEHIQLGFVAGDSSDFLSIRKNLRVIGIADNISLVAAEDLEAAEPKMAGLSIDYGNVGITTMGGNLTWNEETVATQTWVTNTLLGEGAHESLDTISELSAALKNNADIIDTLAVNTNVVHLSGDETIEGIKTFNDNKIQFYDGIDLLTTRTYENPNAVLGLPAINIGFIPTLSTSHSAIAIGNMPYAYQCGIAIGESALAYGNSDIAIGNRAQRSDLTSGSGALYNNIMIGSSVKSTSSYALVIGASSEANNYYAISLGYKAIANAKNAIQLGTGTNATEKTLQVFDYQLLDTNGKIPNERLSDLIATKTDIAAIINYGTNMSYGKNTQLDWYYQHQYLQFGEITTVGQKVLNLYSQSLNAGDYQSHTIYVQELVVVDISKGTGLNGSDTITFTPTKQSYSGFYSNDLYHTLGTSEYDKKQTMSRYGISKALEGLNKTIIRR